MTASPPANPQPASPQKGRGRLLKNLPAEQRKNLLEDIIGDIKDVWQLFWHPAVRFSTKLIMIATLIYVLMPDFLTGPFDDVIVAYFGSQWFLSRATADLVASAAEDQNDGDVVQ